MNKQENEALGACFNEPNINQHDPLPPNALSTITEVLNVTASDITGIKVMKTGMTNHSFQFICKGKKYMIRIPGEGTDQLINREEEASVYHKIEGKQICDDIIYMNPINGYKITEFLEGARVCDPENPDEIRKCMKKLRAFHELGLTVDHEFDIFNRIHFYEMLWEGTPSEYKDYKNTKDKVLSLKTYIDEHVGNKVLTHIDAVPDNFLFVIDEKGEEQIKLIDWEYAGMQDPHVDIAMFCIYSFYKKRKIDRLIQAYFTEGCTPEIRIKIYCYIAICGLLWSNWCEYKKKLGIEFGDYSLKQYQYAKNYYKVAQSELAKLEEKR